jgi:hypothetical protein
MADLSPTDQRELQLMLQNFPASLDQAIADWAKFKVAIETDMNMFTLEQRRNILDWYRSWPKYWEALKPNYDPSIGGDMVSTHRLNTLEKANAFAARLQTEPAINVGLGIAPLIIAGILIAGALGVAGAFWAIGYARKQANITAMIDGVVAGKIPADVLRDAIAKDTNPIADITGLLKWGLLGVLGVIAAPHLIELFKATKTRYAKS